MKNILDEALEASSVDLYSMHDDDLIESCNAIRQEITRPSDDRLLLEDLNEALDRLCAEAVARGLL